MLKKLGFYSWIWCLALLASGTCMAANTIWTSAYEGNTGDSIQVVIGLTNDSVAVDGFTFDLAFDPSMLTYVSCARGTLNPGWILFDCNSPSPGIVRAGAFGLSAIPAGSNGSFVLINFTVTCGACTDGQVSALTIQRLLDDLSTFTPVPGTFTFRIPPTPTPTFTPTPIPTDTPIPTATPTPEVTPTPAPIPATDPVGLGIIILVISGILGLSSFRRK